MCRLIAQNTMHGPQGSRRRDFKKLRRRKVTLKIIDDPEMIALTASEAVHLRREWWKACQYNTEPPTFEEFVRSRIKEEK
jgi:hypothetical protein